MMVVLLIALISVFISPRAFGRDSGQYGEVSPPIRDWIKSLKTPRSGSPGCCDIADGNRDILWDTEGDGDGKRYRVRVAGEWIAVPPDAVITEPNRVGYPIVWTRPGDRGLPVVVCFLPGAGG